MITLKSNKPFKIIDKINLELPQLVVLTGVNGAGKTQLLTAISQQNLESSINSSIISHNKITYLSNSTLVPVNPKTFHFNESIQKVQQLWQLYEQYLNTKKLNPSLNLDVFLNPKSRPRQHIENLQHIISVTKKDPDNISFSDIKLHIPLENKGLISNIFQHDLSKIIKSYSNKFYLNKFNEFYSLTTETNKPYLTDEKFTKLYGSPPWITLNEILKTASLDFSISIPEEDPEVPYTATFIHSSTKNIIPFSEISSGEKVIVSLVFALYNSEHGNVFPDVLLLDEPDASLHPSMIKQFMAVIKDVFIKQHGVHVIMTTHSPSTIALSPEESIFVMDKTTRNVEKVSKDKALKILTVGVPSLSINYENRRQVFVESPYDVQYYEKFHSLLVDKLNPEISLTFISSGDSRTNKNGIKVSNCGQVKNITKTLRKGGNNLIWGIIDWDTTNKETDHIKVLGENKRYNIENYIFDPILITALLLREKLVERTDLGLTNNESYSDFKHLDETQLQTISDFFISQISTKINPSGTDKLTVQYVNGKQIEVPTWYLQHQGHELEGKILELYPQLNDIKKNDEALLKLGILNKVVDDIPGLIPQDLLDLLLGIQEI